MLQSGRNLNTTIVVTTVIHKYGNAVGVFLGCYNSAEYLIRWESCNGLIGENTVLACS